MKDIIEKVCQKILPKVKTVHELCIREYKSLSADMEKFDGALHGGIPVGCITEVLSSFPLYFIVSFSAVSRSFWCR